MPACVFVDSIFLSSFVAVTLVCMTTALWGALLLVSKRSLLSESLSHASYPGLLLGALLSYKVSLFSNALALIVLLGCVASVLGYGLIYLLEKKLSMDRDLALCFVLVSFFGIGVLLSSFAKECCPLLYNKINAYLYGQAATIGFAEANLAYGVFLLSILVIWWWYRQIAVSLFDRDFAATCGIKVKTAEIMVLLLTSLIIVSGVRSVGIVLISSMFVAPPLGARQLSDKLPTILCLSSLFGGVCGALGCYLSVMVTCYSFVGSRTSVALPTGPLVVVIAGCLTFLCLLFSPKSGWAIRFFRKKRFLFIMRQEHLLKVLWYLHEDGENSVTKEMFVCSRKYREYFGKKKFPYIRMWLLRMQGVVVVSDSLWGLSDRGIEEAKRLVRAHRLWESFLVNTLSFHKDGVHNFAEEMEHVLTDELDLSLTELLNDPGYDPHQRSIPQRKR